MRRGDIPLVWATGTDRRQAIAASRRSGDGPQRTQAPIAGCSKGFRALVAVLVLLLLAALVPDAGIQAQPATPVATNTDRYQVDATFDPTTRTIAGTLRLTWFNHTGQPQSRLPFRLYPNAPAYDNGGIVIASATTGGREIDFTLADDSTVLWVETPDPVANGAAADIELTLSTSVPTATSMAVNVLHGSAETGWWLADWLPILAGWEPGIGWFLDPPGPLGNPTFATSAIWSLTFTIPADLSIFGTGEITTESLAVGDTRQVTIETPLVRDLTLVLLPTASLEVTAHQVGDLLVRLVLPREWVRPELIDLVFATAASVLPSYATWMGDLPGVELDLVPVSLNGFGGIAWSGSIWLDLERQADTELDPATRADLRFVLAHELAHQWVPATIGSNNNHHNFLSESLASHLALMALAAYGDREIDTYFAENIVAPYRAMLERGEDGVVDDPVTTTVATAERAALVYGKGVIGFEAIRQAIGTDAYLAGLSAYAETFRFGISTPADLRLAFETTSGQDLDPLWNIWFESAATNLADLDAVLSDFSFP